MNTQNEIAKLRSKFSELINLYERTKQEKTELTNKVNQLEMELKECKEQFNKTDSELELIKIAKSVSGSADDTHDAKIKINRIVREIDKCIALMNR